MEKEGEDILENFKTITDIPKKINFKKLHLKKLKFDVKFLLEKDFSKINDKFANPRNAACWIFKTKKSKETAKIPLKIFCIWIWF